MKLRIGIHQTIDLVAAKLIRLIQHPRVALPINVLSAPLGDIALNADGDNDTQHSEERHPAKPRRDVVARNRLVVVLRCHSRPQPQKDST